MTAISVKCVLTTKEDKNEKRYTKKHKRIEKADEEGRKKSIGTGRIEIENHVVRKQISNT